MPICWAPYSTKSIATMPRSGRPMWMWIRPRPFTRPNVVPRDSTTMAAPSARRWQPSLWGGNNSGGGGSGGGSVASAMSAMLDDVAWTMTIRTTTSIESARVGCHRAGTRLIEDDEPNGGLCRTNGARLRLRRWTKTQPTHWPMTNRPTSIEHEEPPEPIRSVTREIPEPTTTAPAPSADDKGEMPRDMAASGGGQRMAIGEERRENGKLTRFYENGVKAAEGEFRNGKPARQVAGLVSHRHSGAGRHLRRWRHGRPLDHLVRQRSESR